MKQVELITKNWKSTLCGALALVTIAFSASPLCPPEWVAIAGAVATGLGSFGLMFSKDGDK